MTGFATSVSMERADELEKRYGRDVALVIDAGPSGRIPRRRCAVRATGSRCCARGRGPFPIEAVAGPLVQLNRS